MKIIRQSVFETNSLSTHSLTICDKSDYDRWANGETFLVKNAYGIKEAQHECDRESRCGNRRV